MSTILALSIMLNVLFYVIIAVIVYKIMIEKEGNEQDKKYNILLAAVWPCMLASAIMEGEVDRENRDKDIFF